ncbi:MAG: hypothetical protein ACI89U_003112 [Gammaproteobacteria bacterium]|jgi:hypothetical protein
MYVCELDRPWLDTPFILQGFKIVSHEEIETISEHCEFVYIEGSIDAWLHAEKRTIATKTNTKSYSNTLSNKQEFHQATTIHENTRQLTRTFIDDVRLGLAIDVQEVKKKRLRMCIQYHP